MADLERIASILPRVLAHLWSATRFEYGSSVRRCPCGAIEENNGDRTRYWRWEGRELKRMAIPPPHAEAAP